MFNCRACSSTPFGEFFGCASNEPRRSVVSSSVSKTDVTPDVTEPDPEPELEPVPEYFVPRDEAGVKRAIQDWIHFAHPRAARIWNKQQIMDMLATIAQNVDQSENPVTGPPGQDDCIIWEGNVSENNIPVMEVNRPGDAAPTQTHVVRAFVFLYADQDSLNALKAGKFTMACGTTDCVRLSHVSGYNDCWGLTYNQAGVPTAPNHRGVYPAGPLPTPLQLVDPSAERGSAKQMSSTNVKQQPKGYPQPHPQHYP
eukprot:Selendium_serpulae@DN1905_c0_g1_i2.p1